MTFTRRGVVAAGVTTLVSTVAGCQSGRSDTGHGTTSPGATGGQTSESGSGVEVRLDGPEIDAFLFDGTDVATLGEVEKRHDSYSVPVTLTGHGAERVSDRFRSAGVAGNADEFEVVHRRGDTELSRSAIAEGLAARIAGEEWDGELVIQFGERETAGEVRRGLDSGT